MLIPFDLDSKVRILVDSCIRNNFSFTCFDITRQLSYYDNKLVNHNQVRAAVEKYYFSQPLGGFTKNSGYCRAVTSEIVGLPQVYMPREGIVSKYDKDFLDPKRVEQPKIVEKTLMEKIKDEMASGKATEASLLALIGIHKPNTNVGEKLTKVYAVRDTVRNLWGGTKPSSGSRRWVSRLTDANFYGQKYRTAAIINAHKDKNLEVVEFNLRSN